MLTPIEASEDSEKEWESIKQCIKKAVAEALWKKKKIRNKKGLTVLSDEITNAIAKKKEGISDVPSYKYRSS